MKLLDKKGNSNTLIYSEFQPILKELKSKFCPLHELKNTSIMEDIDLNPLYTFTEIVKKEKIAYAVKLEKKRID
jgi:hypothetical protein